MNCIFSYNKSEQKKKRHAMLVAVHKYTNVHKQTHINQASHMNIHKCTSTELNQYIFTVYDAGNNF